MRTQLERAMHKRSGRELAQSRLSLAGVRKPGHHAAAAAWATLRSTELEHSTRWYFHQPGLRHSALAAVMRKGVTFGRLAGWLLHKGPDSVPGPVHLMIGAAGNTAGSPISSVPGRTPHEGFMHAHLPTRFTSSPQRCQLVEEHYTSQRCPDPACQGRVEKHGILAHPRSGSRASLWAVKLCARLCHSHGAWPLMFNRDLAGAVGIALAGLAAAAGLPRPAHLLPPPGRFDNMQAAAAQAEAGQQAGGEEVDG